jgi:hypothetical protein
MRKLITSDDATPASAPLVKPCSDCPWSRDALNGWLGGNTIEEWIGMAHGEAYIECHVHPNVQCAGAGIYRGNVAKRPLNRHLLVLPANRAIVFSSPKEFREHHERRPSTKR